MCMPELSVHGWPAETGQEHFFRSSGARWDCEFWVESQVCFAPGTFLADAAPLQLYSFMERSWLQRRKTSYSCCCWKQLSLLRMEEHLMDQKTVFLPRIMELWVSNTSKNSLTNQGLQCLCWHLNWESLRCTSLDILDGNASCLIVQLQLLKRSWKTQWKKSCPLPCSANPAQHQKLSNSWMATISACWPCLLSHTSCFKSVTSTLQWLVLPLISH